MTTESVAVSVPLQGMRKSLTPATLPPIVAMIAIAIGGCTQLEVRPYHGGMVEGIPYTLPNKSFLIAVEYEVKECTVKSGKLFLDIKKTASTTELVEPGERFYIPYSSIRNAFKDTDVVVESYDNSTLKGISAQVDDKTGPAIAAIFGGALRLVKLVASPTLPVAAAADQELRKQYCKDSIIDVLDKIAVLRKASTKADESASEIENLREALKFKQAVKWVPDKNAASAGGSRVDTTVYPEHFLNSQAWVTAAGLKALREEYGKEAADPKFPIEHLITHVTIDLVRPINNDPTLADVLSGVVVRNPTQGLLRICDGHCPVQEGVVDGVVGTSDVTVPQLGDYVVLPLRNRIFQNQKIELTMSESGALQKIGVNSKATASSAAESFNANFDQIKDYRDAREKAKDDARTAAANQPSIVAKKTTEINQALTACFEAQKALKEAGGAPVGTCQ